jgi:radical SAM protein with 4Fe4S-binding SPASM domain
MFREMRDKKGGSKPVLKVQTLWSAIKHNPDEYLDLMHSIVDKVSYNPDMNFKEISLVPDPDFCCPRLWQRIAITSEGDVLRCPSDFEKDNVLGNLQGRTIKSFWDKEMEDVREKHRTGRKDEDLVCRKCHHGAKKVLKDIEVEGHVIHGGDYNYVKEFKGHGLVGKE